MNPLLLVDSYKVNHFRMYPEGMTKLYSNFTPRKSRIEGVNEVVVFGIQHFILEYLIKKFNKDFFMKDFRISGNHPEIVLAQKNLKRKVIEEYKKHCNVDTTHIEALWDLGYLPLEIKALEEGTLCPIGVPMLTITNTHPDFGWLVNYLETLISCMLWQPITSATIAYEYKKILNKYALETTGSTEGVQWQGHDFSMRGMSSVESTILSGMGHLLSFTGTDTIPAIYQLENSYKAQGLIGASVPATEHSVMCMGLKESEVETFRRLMNTYPTGILSVVSDTWDLWKVCTEYLPQLKEEILARDGKLVIRPDSGDPVDIICGARNYWIFDSTNNRVITEDGKLNVFYTDKLECSNLTIEKVVNLFNSTNDFVLGSGGIVDKYLMDEGDCSTEDMEFITEEIYSNYYNQSSIKGVIELLWDIFGGTTNEQGYKVLDSHIGAIYGDSITRERAIQICERLKAKGFASTNIVLGIGSYTYQYNTRDTFGFAMKATGGEVNGEWREIFKDPITDDGTKKSKKGLLKVDLKAKEPNGWELYCDDQCTWEQEKTGLLTTVFLDGKLTREVTLDEIRNKLK